MSSPSGSKDVAESAIWLIYSREHNAFWKPNERGYTTLVTEAGRYTGPRALRICIDANLGLAERSPNEVAVLDPEVAVLNAQLLSASRAARRLFDQGCVDRGFSDERNWIDDTLDEIDAALLAAKGTNHVPPQAS